jgi:hypothetical protein
VESTNVVAVPAHDSSRNFVTAALILGRTEYLNFLALVNQYAPIILISSQEIDPVLVLASGAIFKAWRSDRKIFEQI